MPAFFIPYSKTDQEEGIYNNIKIFIQSQGFKPNNNRVYSITYTYNGVNYTDTVGKGNKLLTEVVIAIFETDSMYLICTATRGGLRGEPILIGKELDTTVVFFDT